MKITKTLIDKYLSGGASAEEVTAIENALANQELDLADYMPESEWQQQDRPPDFDNKSTLKVSLFKQLGLGGGSHHTAKWLRYAAAILTAGIGLWLAYTQLPSPEPITAQRAASPPSVPSPVQTGNLYYINSGNTVLSLTAPDGSGIELYPNSEVKFSADFSTTQSRDIQLKGKARFTVAKDKSKPFRVHTTGLTTTALGTIFTVDALGTSITKIKLHEGRIEVQGTRQHPDGNALKLQFMPEEEISISRDQQIVAETRITATRSSQRGSYRNTAGQLFFKNLPLEDVLRIISHNYPVKLNYDAQDIQDKYYSGTYTDTAEVYRRILADIQQLHRISITIQNE